MPPVGPHASALAALTASFALALLVASLFSRFHREQALEHKSRQRILDILTRQGPTSFPELGRALQADRTTIEHHVRLLAKTGFVTLARGGRSVFVLLPGQELDPALDRGGTHVAQTLVRILREHGGAMPRNALHAAAPAYSPRTRNGALHRLITTGAIERAIEGNVEIVRLKPQGARSST